VDKLPQTINYFNVHFKEKNMLKVLVTYKVKPDRVTENEELVKAVYDELRENNDPDIHYATFKLDDGQTFSHIASFASPEKQAELTESTSFQAFRENLPDRCEVPPNPQKLNEIDSYNFV
jgi:quinol monooxygenase YgiN